MVGGFSGSKGGSMEELAGPSRGGVCVELYCILIFLLVT